VGHIEDDIMQNHEQTQKLKQSENLRFYGQNELFFGYLALQLWGRFSHMATYRSSLISTRKMNLELILNNNSPRAHMELEFNVLGVGGKLVKYIIHLSKRKKVKKNLFVPKQ
jgi:hypothetical protein